MVLAKRIIFLIPIPPFRGTFRNSETDFWNVSQYQLLRLNLPNLPKLVRSTNPGAEKKGDNTMLCRPEIRQSSMQRLRKNNNGFERWTQR